MTDSFPVLSCIGISNSDMPLPCMEWCWFVPGWEGQSCLIISPVFRHMQLVLILPLLPSHISIWALGGVLFSHFYFRETFSGLIGGTTLNEIFVSKFPFVLIVIWLFLPYKLILFFFCLLYIFFLSAQKYMWYITHYLKYKECICFFFQFLIYLKPLYILWRTSCIAIHAIWDN